MSIRCMARWRWQCLLLCAWCWVAAAQAQAALTLESALERAQARSHQLPAQDAAVQAAREMAIAAGQLPDPVLRAGITNLPVDGPDRFALTRDFMTMRSVGVMQEFTRSDKRAARAARFDREADAGAAGRAVALLDLRRSTAVAWLELHYWERLRDALAVQRTEATLQIDAAQATYRGGRGAQADVFAARLAVARIDDEVLQTQRRIATARTQLARWIGADAEQPLALPPATDRLRLTLPGLDAQLEHHPRMVQLDRQVAIALAQAEIARTGKRADWSIEVMFSQRGPAYSNLASVNLSLPLHWDQAKRQDRELAGALAVVEQRREERAEALRELVAQGRAMLASWHVNQERLTLFDSTLMPLARERTRATLASYRGGAAPLVSVLEARRMEIDTALDRLRLEIETASLWAGMEFLLPADRDLSARTEQKP